MTPTAEYSAMLYALADEIREQEGCVTASPEEIEDAAERMDVQTVTINVLMKQRDGLLAAIREILDDAEECQDHDDWTAMLVSLDAFHNLDTAYNATINTEKSYGRPEKKAEIETTVQAIVFYPAGSLGEPIDIEIERYKDGWK